MGLCNLARWRKLAGEAGGSEIAEFAAVVPIVVLLLFAILWFARAFNIYTTITYAAREGAQVAVVGKNASCATCGSPLPTAADVEARVAEVLRASHIDPGQIKPYLPTPAPSVGGCSGSAAPSTSNNVAVYSGVQLNFGSVGPPACGVIVSFEYPFDFTLLNAVPPFGTRSFNLLLKADAQMQGEN
jgi:TadE-like protein